MKNELIYLNVADIFPHKDNPRKELGDLTELADSIRENGIMQNLTVVPDTEFDGGYTVIIGHRRLAAAKLAGLTEVPCVIAEMSPQEQVATMLLENIQRSDLTVYEQAQGFQMMMDFGVSVEDISKQTGFSKTTVRRRLKMAELDQGVLKEVSARQISLDDFDRLAQIEDLEKRNKVLEQIGTNNFESAVLREINEQKKAKILPYVQKWIKEHHGNKISWSETYGGKYDVLESFRLESIEEGQELLRADRLPEKLYYCLDNTCGWVKLCRARPKASPVKRPKKELDREKYVAETREKLDALAEECYQLRCAFIKTLRVSSRNADAILCGAVAACALQVMTYISSNSAEIESALGVKDLEYGEKVSTAVTKLISGASEAYAKVVHAAFGDRKDNAYHGGYRGYFPEHKKNAHLDALYTWLESLGYQMSDEEKQLQDGTHPLFVDKDEVSE